MTLQPRETKVVWTQVGEICRGRVLVLGSRYVQFSLYSDDATASGAEPSSGWIVMAARPIGGELGTKSLGPEIGARRSV